MFLVYNIITKTNKGALKMNKKFYQEMLKKHGEDDFIKIFVETVKNHEYGEDFNIINRKRIRKNGGWVGNIPEACLFEDIYNKFNFSSLYNELKNGFDVDKLYWFYSVDFFGDGYIYSFNRLLDGIEYYYQATDPDVVKAIEKALKEK